MGEGPASGASATLHFTDPAFHVPAKVKEQAISVNKGGELGDNATVSSPDPSPPNAHQLICATLRGEDAAWPWGDDAAAVDEFLLQADVHGVQALLHGGANKSNWPQSLIEELRRTAIQQAIRELGHQQVLSQTLAALDTIAVQPVLIKGTALAYSLYADPVLRARGDTDLIIPIEAKERVHEVLTELGFERQLGMAGEFVSYQASYTRGDPMSGVHTLDVHWKINNSELLSRLFTYGELRHEAQPLPRLCPQALATSRVHALLLACMHCATHQQNPYYVRGKAHHDPDRMIWLYDIHLLAQQLNADEWERFSRLAAEKGLRAVCVRALHRASTLLSSVASASGAASLAASGSPEEAELYLNGSKLRQQWMDFWALESMSKQSKLLREIVLPSPAYMRQKYRSHPRTSLPWLYVRRAVGGIVDAVLRATGRASMHSR